MKLNILIIGVNGFIGCHLASALLDRNYQVTGIDISDSKINHLKDNPNFRYYHVDILKSNSSLEDYISAADVVFPLAAIATPITYIKNPIYVFELDFESNLKILRFCVDLKKHIVFPSSSEVYGMCNDLEFDEEKSNLIVGPINKTRWIYSTCKQLLDRLICAYGERDNLSYTIFRPFNWIGPNLDNIHNESKGGSRVVTQLIGNYIRNEDMMLTDGGKQKRCFIDIEDAISALVKIVETKDKESYKQIFNIGNPKNEFSIQELASIIINECDRQKINKDTAYKGKLISVNPLEYYGEGYEDMKKRKPAIKKISSLLNWSPTITLQQSIEKIITNLKNRLNTSVY